MPAASSVRRDPQDVRQLFDAIAFRYDFLNHLFSARIHRRWIKQLTMGQSFCDDAKILDVCTGTADVAIALAQRYPTASLKGLDFSLNMLALAQDKIRKIHLQDRIHLIHGDALQMPFDDRTFDAVFNSFGLRNEYSYPRALKEMARVLKRHGHIHILEFSRPRHSWMRKIYKLYLTTLMPFVSRLFLKEHDSFDYLAQTIDQFPSPEQVMSLLGDCGFQDIRVESLTGGIACIYRGRLGKSTALDARDHQ